ncbi:MAG: cytochrome P450 [Aeromicrobium erythreum]
MSNEHFPLIDRTALLARDGYRFAERRRRTSDEDATRTRIAGSPALFVRGPEAVRFFYGDPALVRDGAIPEPVKGPLFGPGAVHGLDGAAHTTRKRWFLDVLDVEAVRHVSTQASAAWTADLVGWRDEVDVFRHAATTLFEVATRWAGVVVPLDQRDRRVDDMVAMVDGFGSAGPRHLRARTARSRSQSWAAALVEQARREGATGALADVAAAADEHGRPLPVEVAATELLNLVRPQVAVAWLVAGGTRAIAGSPSVREAVRSGEVTPLELAQEVRRTTPFVPMLAARAARPTSWAGVDVPEGGLVVLDVWGTNHDPRVWRDPDRFDPTRFRREPVTDDDLVPQGGGDPQGHRCPGEDLTIALLTAMLPPLAELDLDLTFGGHPGLRRMPPRPRCDVLVRPRAEARPVDLHRRG